MPDSKPVKIPQRVSALLPYDGDAIVDCDGLRLEERRNLVVIQVLAYAAQHESCAAAIGKALGIECPVLPGNCNSNELIQISWNSPNSWLLISDDESSADLLVKIKKAVADKAAVVDQSHGRSGLRLSGEHARKVMAKNCALDFHSSVFNSGSSALTSVAHMNALVIQVDESPSYDLFVARSLARSFAHAIEHSCHEFSKA